MKNIKKAFTLVELLVVIAILAVLASVSIIGYTAFTKKAVENNAIAELTQLRTLISGSTRASEDGYVVEFDAGKYKFTFSEETNEFTIAEETTADAELTVGQTSNEARLTGSFDFDLTNGAQKITYTLQNGGNQAEAVWNLEDNSIKLK